MVGLVTAMALTGFATTSSACEAEPWWHLTVSSRPSSLKAGSGSDEVQEINAASGSAFILEVSGNIIGPFESDPFPKSALSHATAANMQSALEAVYGTGQVTVTGGPGGVAPLVVTSPNRSVLPIERVIGSVETKVLKEGHPDGRIVLEATNLGEAPIEGEAQPVTIADSLPPGLEAVGVEGIAGGLPGLGGPVNCSNASVSCTFESALEPYQPIEVGVQVRVKPGASSGEVDAATVSGGGASAVSAAQRLTFGGEPVFGVQGFEIAPEEEGGALDTQAGSHPFQLTTTVNLDQTGEGDPAALAKDLAVKLPPGLIGNPTPLPRCTAAQFLHRIPPGFETNAVRKPRSGSRRFPTSCPDRWRSSRRQSSTWSLNRVSPRASASTSRLRRSCSIPPCAQAMTMA